ncbi:MAG TPA: GAF domain-containing SpoIIE family protein phosphatase [Brevefilum sp.]
MNLSIEQKYKLLFEISHKTSDTLDLDEIMVQLLDTIKSVVDYDAAGIFVLNQAFSQGTGLSSKNLIAGMSFRGYGQLPNGDDMLTHGKGIIGYVITNNTSLVVPDIRLDEHYVEGRSETLSEIAVPIQVNNQSIGAVNLESDQLGAYNENDLSILQFFADAAAIALEKAILHRQIMEKELLDKQLQMAKDVQTHLLPMSDPVIPGYDISGICIPAEKIGGDYYDYLYLQGGKLGIVVADVSGHGISSALVMSAFRSQLRTYTHGSDTPAQIACSINERLPEFTGGNHFITMIYGLLDATLGKFTFTRCGHPSPTLIHGDGSSEVLHVNKPAFGIYRKVQYMDETKTISPSDILVFFTDGVVDTENHDGEAFGTRRLMAAVTKYRNLSSKALIQEIINQTRIFNDFQPFQDDFTLVIVKKE